MVKMVYHKKMSDIFTTSNSLGAVAVGSSMATMGKGEKKVTAKKTEEKTMKEDGMIERPQSKMGANDPENYLKSHGEFDSAFIELFLRDSFLGCVSADITKFADPKCPTAYMGLRKHGLEWEQVLGYSPKFFRSLSMNERCGVIRHELYHLIFQHIFVRAVGDVADQKLWNWATDLAINSIIGEENLPSLCLIPGKAPIDPATGKLIDGPYAEFISKAPKHQASDYYFSELKKIREQNDDGSGGVDLIIGSGLGTMDDHDAWGEIDPDVMEEIRNKIGGLVERAMTRADRDNSWGTVPQSIQEMIRKMYSHEIDWRSIIRNFIGRSRSLERNSTIKRINKKMPYIHPGVKRPLIANFVCFMDQSGSMSDEDIALLFSELQGLSTLVELDVYHFDTEIDESSHRRWKKNDPFPPLRTRCGGTDFQSVANFLNRSENRGRWSGAIILTDGYAPTMGAVQGAKVLWVITETGTMDAIRPGDLCTKMKAGDGGKFKRF